MGGEWMMVKFARVTATASLLTLLVLITLLGAPGFAQTAPAEQNGQTPATAPAAPAPAAQQPVTPNPAASGPAAPQPDASQEPADEISAARRKKVHDYKNWVFDVGGGANLVSGTTRDWVRGGGLVGTVGVARNANKYLGLRADFIFADLPLRDSTVDLAQATGSTDYAFAITLDPIINVPITKEWGGYVLFGASFDHRAGNLSGSATVPGSGCNGFWIWWGACQNSIVSIPLSGNFVNSSLNQFGYNLGGGVTRKMPSGVEVFLEWRLMHGTHNSITTDFRPITIGFRW
jgi:Outer membrane protein beta-barrel domain